MRILAHRTCSIEGCDRTYKGKGYCRLHLDRLRQHHDPLYTPIRHNMCATPEYRAWCHMKERCNNKACKGYKDYGGRGIKVCARWNSFTNFYADMGVRPSSKHSLNRIDNDGDYEPDNCEWTTRIVQNLNRRTKLGKAGYKGVSVDKRDGKYVAQICINYKHVGLGYYSTAEEAHQAYLEAAANR